MLEYRPEYFYEKTLKRYVNKNEDNIETNKMKLIQYYCGKMYKLVFEDENQDEKRTGKEFDEFNNLKFEGEFINRERNGKGKEYNIYGKLIFEGEYLNGKRNGKGKAYNLGKLEFEGKYLNGKKWNGKGYDRKNNIIYEIKNGNGFVKEYGEHGQLIFDGKY